MDELILRDFGEKFAKITFQDEYITIFQKGFKHDEQYSTFNSDTINIPVKNIGTMELLNTEVRIKLPKNVKTIFSVVIGFLIVCLISSLYLNNSSLLEFSSIMLFIILIALITIRTHSIKEKKQRLIIKNNNELTIADIQCNITLEEYGKILNTIRKLQ